MAKLDSLEKTFAKMGLVTRDQKAMTRMVSESYDESEGEDEDEDEEEGYDEMSPGSSDMPPEQTGGMAAPTSSSAPMQMERKKSKKSKKHAEPDGDEGHGDEDASGSEPGPESGAMGRSMGGADMGGAVPSGKRFGAESNMGNDRLELLMGELTRLTEQSSPVSFEGDRKRLVRIFSNVAAVADVVGQRLGESDKLGPDLDKLAEDSLQVAEGVASGKIKLENARQAVKGYVKDLIGGIGEVADELDEELQQKVRRLRKQ